MFNYGNNIPIINIKEWMAMTLKCKRKVFLLFTLVIITLLLTVSGSYFVSRLSNPPEARYFAVFQSNKNLFKPRVTADTVVNWEKIYACKDIEVLRNELASKDMIGLNSDELAAQYPPDAWKITFHGSNLLTMSEQSEELCSIHKDYRHLGIFQDRLAVYEGPLGYNEKIVRVESINILNLPEEMQIKLRQAMKYEKQAAPIAEKLRHEFEFKTEDALDAALENIDEHSLP
jgi:hypothetical protein